MKEYSAWCAQEASLCPFSLKQTGCLTSWGDPCRPTFPQVYIDGEFFGGCDITVGTRGALVFAVRSALGHQCCSFLILFVCLARRSCVSGWNAEGVGREGARQLSGWLVGGDKSMVGEAAARRCRPQALAEVESLAPVNSSAASAPPAIPSYASLSPQESRAAARTGVSRTEIEAVAAKGEESVRHARSAPAHHQPASGHARSKQAAKHHHQPGSMRCFLRTLLLLLAVPCPALMMVRPCPPLLVMARRHDGIDGAGSGPPPPPMDALLTVRAGARLDDELKTTGL